MNWNKNEEQNTREKYTEILKNRIITKEFEKLTSEFGLNTNCYLIPKDFASSPEEDSCGFGFIQKIHEVFELSDVFKTELWCDGLLAGRADLHAVSPNGYLYVVRDGFWDVEYGHSSELTEDFIKDICNAFEKYYGYQMTCN